jgi:hypothetical protein
MGGKESNEYFKKLMNDTQNKIDNLDNGTNSLESELIDSSNQNNKSLDEEVKIDKSKQNRE